MKVLHAHAMWKWKGFVTEPDWAKKDLLNHLTTNHCFGTMNVQNQAVNAIWMVPNVVYFVMFMLQSKTKCQMPKNSVVSSLELYVWIMVLITDILHTIWFSTTT